MDQGYPPDEIINQLIENDIQNNPSIRQYGIVDLEENGRSAAFTGNNCVPSNNPAFDNWNSFWHLGHCATSPDFWSEVNRSAMQYSIRKMSK